MKEKAKIAVADALTLGDFIGNRLIQGNIEIINECNETLLTLAYVENNVCFLYKTLSEDLLSRRILRYGVREGRLLIEVEGVEDAD